MKRFSARLEPVPHGGLFVVVPASVAEAAGLRHGLRVKGTVNGANYRSSLMKYSGIFHMGVHKKTAAEAQVKGGDRVEVTIALDTEPLPTDVEPPDLMKALGRVATARAAWKKLSPATRRGFVQSVLDAKKPETRARRIDKVVEALRHGVPPHKTWSPRAP